MLHHLVRLEVGVALFVDIDLLGPLVGDESSTNLLLLLLLLLVVVVVLLVSTAGRHQTGLAGAETRERDEESPRWLRR